MEQKQQPRRRINQLPPALINRIAAGEVIERPASVVKELVENSVDAGSTQVTVEIEDGGLSLIRIIDNGCGIPPEELPLAFASHATSKLQTDEDLFQIRTMGFRGEALASIGSVSHARILSRVPGAEAGYEIYDRGSQISDPQAAAANAGTVIEVRNLFYNVPARRKFLKGPSTEFGHISETLLRLALPHPGVAFKLLHNGRTALDLPATSEIERLLAAWPKEFADQRLPMEARDAEVKLRGVVGLPELARPTAKYQYVYLNGRHIRDKFITHALREAYRGLTEPGRHPAAILLIEMPPGDVDVNVHPTKSEVRFKDSGRLHGLVLSAVREKLLGSDLTPSAVAQAAGPVYLPDAERQTMQARLAEFFKQSLPSGDTTPLPFPERPAVEMPERSTGAPPVSNAPGYIASRFASIEDSQHGRDARATTEPVAGVAAQSSRVPAIQLHNSYLVAESDEGMVIIDQHALHERIMYEDLRARLSRGPLESQRMLIPAVVQASPRQIDLLDQVQPLLQRLGIEVAQMGPNALAIHAFPSFLERIEPTVFIQELLERGEQELLDLHDEELLHEILDMMACKAAVKAGDPLTQPEIEALLARRDLVERSSNCPHGRPTTLRLSLRDLEKQFKRTGF